MPANYVLLERIELNASAASVTFASIPQTGYTDLKIVVSARCDAANTAFKIRFNGTTTNLSTRYLYGSGSAAASYTEGSNIYGYETASTYTANTFSNSEIYIPNYTSSNVKSVSVDAVTENNATTAEMALFAGLWNNTAAITSVQLVSNTGNFVANSTFSLYGLAALGTTPTLPKANGGDQFYSDGTYWYHLFTTSGTFTANQTLSCDYLVIAGGGGGGGGGVGGGGGAGGYRSGSSLSLSGAIAVTVGAGGSSPSTLAAGFKGSNSVLSSISATGGGGGGSNGGTGATAGGSGGGSGESSLPGAGNEGGYSPVEGYAGGNDSNSPGAYGSGGGGGSAAVGGNGSSSNGGTGGTGTASSITGTSVSRGGGGGGGAYQASGGTATSGGGAGGRNDGPTIAAGSGTVNTGGGGGGSGAGAGGTGGSGIVVIRYAV
jgi:hypothetical protein